MDNRKSITFTKPQIPYIWKEASKLGVTFSEMVRRIIDERRNKGNSHET